METQLIEKQAVQAKFRVTIPATKVDETYESVLQTLARQVRVPGFRPGRAPRGLLIQRLGQETLDQEVRDSLLDKYYPKAVKELELTPIHAHFEAKPPVRSADFSFEVEVDLYPEISLPELSEIVIDTEPQVIGEEEVAHAVEHLQRDHATLVPVERPVEADDYLLVTVVSEDGGEGSLMPLDLETIDPALATQLLGHSIGDEVELELPARQEDEPAASEDGDEEEAAPKKLRVTVSDIKEKEKPEAGEDLAKTLGFDSWEETLTKLRKELQASRDQETFTEQTEEFVEKLLAETSFEIPKSLLERRKRSLTEELEEDLERRGSSYQEYLTSLEAEGARDEHEKDLNETALTRVRRELVLERLLEIRGTTISDEEFHAALRPLAIRSGQDLSRFMREMGSSWLRNYRHLLIRDRALQETVRSLTAKTAGVEEQELAKLEE